jgi:hypothetical protein
MIPKNTKREHMFPRWGTKQGPRFKNCAYVEEKSSRIKTDHIHALDQSRVHSNNGGDDDHGGDDMMVLLMMKITMMVMVVMIMVMMVMIEL